MNTPTTACAHYEELAAQHPLGRMAEITDIVQGVIYLEQATFVTGETLHIDGGRGALTEARNRVSGAPKPRETLELSVRQP